MYGYDYHDGTLVINQQEAKTIRMIYADYLSGMGKKRHLRKLEKLDIPTKQGGRWATNTVVSILTNEKLLGDMCLQKYYITDHLTKRKKRNDGELPRYYVEGSHDGIISHETSRRSGLKWHGAPRSTSILFRNVKERVHRNDHLWRCGAHSAGRSMLPAQIRKAHLDVHDLFLPRKEHCPAKRIPEDILKQKCAEVMGLPAYDSERFKENVLSIAVPDDGVLLFTFLTVPSAL